jgi:hypothetical protein
VSSEVSRSRDQGYLLHEAAKLYAKPSMTGIGHVCANDAARNYSLTRIIPRDAPRTDIASELYEALSCKLVEVELQAVL